MTEHSEEAKSVSPPLKNALPIAVKPPSSSYASPASSEDTIGTLSPSTAGDEYSKRRSSAIAPESLVGRWIEITGDGVPTTATTETTPGLTTKSRGICKVLNFEKAYNPTASRAINSLHTVDFTLSSDDTVGVEQVLLLRRKKVVSWNGGKTYVLCSEAVAAEFEECAAMGFTEKSTYNECKALGFISKFEYDRAMSLGIADKAELVEFTTMGFERIDEFIECKELGYGSKQEYDAHKREQAKLDDSCEDDREGGANDAAGWSSSLGDGVPAPWEPTSAPRVHDPARLVGRWVNVAISRTGFTMVGKVLAFQRKPWWQLADLSVGSMHTIDFSVSGGGVELILLERLKLCQHNSGDQYTVCGKKLSREYEEAYARGDMLVGGYAGGHPLLGTVLEEQGNPH